VSITAATAASPLLAALVEAYAAHYPGATVIVEPGNAYHSLRQVTDGATELGVVSVVVDGDLWTAPLGLDAIAVIVHPDNPLDGLSALQLRDVLSGRTWRWADLGVALSAAAVDEITVVSREEGSGTRLLVEARLLGRASAGSCQPRLAPGDPNPAIEACETEPVTPTAVVVTSSEDVVAFVASHPGAIGYASRGTTSAGVKALRIDGLSPDADKVWEEGYLAVQPLQFVAVEEPSGAARAFVDFCLSPEGQEVVTRHYAPAVQ
jgi:phosphate transport system substrate-binding protein